MLFVLLLLLLQLQLLVACFQLVVSVQIDGKVSECASVCGCVRTQEISSGMWHSCAAVWFLNFCLSIPSEKFAKSSERDRVRGIKVENFAVCVFV